VHALSLVWDHGRGPASSARRSGFCLAPSSKPPDAPERRASVSLFGLPPPVSRLAAPFVRPATRDAGASRSGACLTIVTTTVPSPRRLVRRVRRSPWSCGPSAGAAIGAHRGTPARGIAAPHPLTLRDSGARNPTAARQPCECTKALPLVGPLARDEACG